MANIKELQKEIYELGGLLDQEKIKKIVVKILELLEDKFILRIETWDNNKDLKDIFKFLKDEEINAKTYEGRGFFWGEAYGIETNINKNILLNNLNKLFNLFFLDYQFEDSKKIITLTHDGDLKITG